MFSEQPSGLRTWIPLSTHIRDGAGGGRPVTWPVKQLNGSLGIPCADPDYGGKRLGRLVLREYMKRLRESSENGGWYRDGIPGKSVGNEIF